MSNPWLAASAASGLVATAAGAFGAHGLRGRLSPEMLGVFEIGVRYQMYHALALGLVGLLAARGTPGLSPSGWLFSAGTVLFSGSLYLLALTGHRWLGAVTPIGGLSLLAGWLALLVAAVRPG